MQLLDDLWAQRARDNLQNRFRVRHFASKHRSG